MHVNTRCRMPEQIWIQRQRNCRHCTQAAADVFTARCGRSPRQETCRLPESGSDTPQSPLYLRANMNLGRRRSCLPIQAVAVVDAGTEGNAPALPAPLNVSIPRSGNCPGR